MSAILAAALGALGAGTVAGAFALAWKLFGGKATTATTTLITKGVDLGFGALEKIPELAKSALVLSLLQHTDVLADDLVTNEIASAAAVVNKDGFTKAALSDMPGALLASLKSLLPQAEQLFLATNPSAAAPVLVKLQAAVTTAAASMRTVKLASGSVTKLAPGAPLPAGAELVAS